MKTVVNHTAGVCLVLLFLIVCVSTRAEAQEPSTHQQAERAVEPEDVLLTARVESERGGKASPDKPIVLVATIKNVTDQRVLLYETNFLLDYKIEVRDEAGRKIDLTEAGVRRHRDAGGYYGWKPVYLSPGKRFEERFDIAGLYDLEPGGTYRIRLRRRLHNLDETQEEAGEVASNTIKIRP